jgi:hypothetical protein
MHSFKLIHIARHHGQIMNQGNGSNLQIIGTDNACSTFKALSERPVNVRTRIIEGKRSYFSKKVDYLHSPSRNVAVFLSAVHQFGTDDGTDRQLRKSDLRKPINQNKISTFENLDPHIRVQQETHYQVLAGGIGSSSGSSGSSSAQHPIMCAKSGLLRFNSSRVGSSFSFSTSEMASRTRDSSTRAFSGSSRSKVRSSSSAIVVTGKPCHTPVDKSNPHFQTP